MPNRTSFDHGRVAEAATRIPPALATLAGVLAAHGEPADAPFARFVAPPPAAVAALDPASAADWAVGLVHAVFAKGPHSGALTAAVKGVGNAARGVRRALAREGARRADIARREATPLPVTMGQPPKPPARPVKTKKTPSARLAA